MQMVCSGMPLTISPRHCEEMRTHLRVCRCRYASRGSAHSITLKVMSSPALDSAAPGLRTDAFASSCVR
jgi:hypothetical protein